MNNHIASTALRYNSRVLLRLPVLAVNPNGDSIWAIQDTHRRRLRSLWCRAGTLQFSQPQTARSVHLKVTAGDSHLRCSLNRMRAASPLHATIGPGQAGSSCKARRDRPAVPPGESFPCVTFVRGSNGLQRVPATPHSRSRPTPQLADGFVLPATLTGLVLPYCSMESSLGIQSSERASPHS